MRFKFLIITSTILFSSATFAQQDKTNIVKQDSVQLFTKFSPRAIVEDGRDSAPVLTNKMDSRNEIFYSNASMYVAPKDASATDKVSMFVLGTVKFDNNAKIRQFGETSLTGDFVSVKDAVNTADINPLFPVLVDGANKDGGVINFVGQWNKQKITREERERDAGGNIVLLKDATKTNVNNSNSVLHFPTIKVVKDGVTSLEKTNWLIHPVTGVKLAQAGMESFLNTKGMLEVSSNVAIGIAKLDVTGGNRFVVEAVTDGLDDASTATDKAAYYKINSAYVDIRENVGVTTKPEEPGFFHPGYHELKMKLYNYSSGTNDESNPSVPHTTNDTDLKDTNTYPVKAPAKSDMAGTTVDATFFRGFTSPFNNLRADYMFYHVLTKPDHGGINSQNAKDGRRRPVEDPKTEIKPGHGYFFAMDASREYYENIKYEWHTNAGETSPTSPNANPAWRARERGGYNFSRLMREWKYDVVGAGKTENFNLYNETTAKVANSVATYEQQRFNTDQVTVELKGVNDADFGTHFYLANPFMTPISLRTLLTKDGDLQNAPNDETDPKFNVPFDVPGLSGTNADEKVKAGYENIPVGTGPFLRARYWVVNTGLLVHDPSGPGRYFYNVKYDLADLFGTGTVADAPSRYLEPMQMFVVQASKGGSVVFNNSLKTFKGQPFEKVFRAAEGGDFETPGVPRSAFAAEAEVETEKPYVMPDWFVIQAVVEKDGAITADRTAVRFYNGATEGFDSQFDVEKKVISAEALTKARAGDNTYADDNISPTNVIYTTTAAGEPLLGNGVNYSIKEIPLHYLSGSTENENVTLSFYGIEGFENAPQGWLVDTHKNVKHELKEGLEYPFVSTPEEGSLTAKNRFLLQFYDDGTTGPTLTENPITCYYSGSTLHIGGLNEKDLGSKVFIYDLQGRLMGSTTINDYPGMEYRKVLGQGTFVVKIVGKRNYGTKFVNLQNY